MRPSVLKVLFDELISTSTDFFSVVDLMLFQNSLTLSKLIADCFICDLMVASKVNSFGHMPDL